jgi:hypothetical protein
MPLDVIVRDLQRLVERGIVPRGVLIGSRFRNI